MAPDSLEVDDVADFSPKSLDVDSIISYIDENHSGDSPAEIQNINAVASSSFSPDFPKSFSMGTSTPKRGKEEAEKRYENKLDVMLCSPKDGKEGLTAAEEFPRRRISDIIKQLGLQDTSTINRYRNSSPRYRRSVDETIQVSKNEFQQRETKPLPKPVPLPRVSKMLQISRPQIEENDDCNKDMEEEAPIYATINGSVTDHEEDSDTGEATLPKRLSEPCETEFDETSFEPDGPEEQTFRVIFIGDAGVGKSSFALRISKGVFVRQMSSTLGVDFLMRTLHVDGRNVAVQLWDTAGQERFRSITKSYFRKADGVLLLYDCTCEQSFLNVRQWVEDVDNVSSNKIPLLIVANKIDLRHMALKTGQRCISTEEGEKLAKDCDTTFIEASAKDGSNVIPAIAKLIRMMSSHDELQTAASTMQLCDTKPKKASCCGK